MTRKQPVKRGTGRNELIAATLRLIADRGLHAVTLRDVAGESRLSLGSTTYHFADRTALMRAAITEYVADVESLVTDAADTSRKRRDVQADGGVHAAMRRLFTDRRQVLIRAELRLEATRDDALRELHLRCRDAVQTLVAAVLGAGQQPACAHAVWAAMAAMDTAAVDTAGDRRDPAEFAAAMNTYLAEAFDVSQAS